VTFRRSGEDRDLTTVPHLDKRPILFLDVDGVISLFGFPRDAEPPGTFHSIDGIPHCIGHAAAPLLAQLADRFELVWATGWEEKANEYLPPLLGLGSELPVLTFDGRAVFGSAHWKIAAVDAYAGDRPAAWIDDFLNDECRTWAELREAPTLLIETESATGLTEEHVERLLGWADQVRAG
jgi:Swiss Army Knife RNA repair-like protein